MPNYNGQNARRIQQKEEKAIEELLKIFEPLLKTKSIFNGQLDEDVFQELSIKFAECAKKFKICYNMDISNYLKNRLAIKVYSFFIVPIEQNSWRKTHIVREKCLPVFVKQQGCTICVKECIFAQKDYEEVHGKL